MVVAEGSTPPQSSIRKSGGRSTTGGRSIAVVESRGSKCQDVTWNEQVDRTVQEPMESAAEDCLLSSLRCPDGKVAIVFFHVAESYLILLRCHITGSP